MFWKKYKIMVNEGLQTLMEEPIMPITFALIIASAVSADAHSSLKIQTEWTKP